MAYCSGNDGSLRMDPSAWIIARPCSDRGYVYWRLLSTNPEAAKAVVLAERPTITDDSSQVGR